MYVEEQLNQICAKRTHTPSYTHIVCENVRLTAGKTQPQFIYILDEWAQKTIGRSNKMIFETIPVFYCFCYGRGIDTDRDQLASHGVFFTYFIEWTSHIPRGRI